ncbi:hypothetical protein AKJ53_01465 [candidate division MSBL1 archaeon SCGC-AAA382F02]|uniref:Peptidase S49 domain-containing protein n=1 Tax=candidate division MSBL1 archaeon SCGC-AAA382F02 TaxID=1698282 RepID=A0A133VI07_9EURY|nr:hypothetical protein AKJ53_01465 [candidate division MSBL1 archaeon SCGC-AAA382F02]
MRREVPRRRPKKKPRSLLSKLVVLVVLLALIVGGIAFIYSSWTEAPSAKIGVLNINGYVGDFEYADLAEKARNDSSIKAVVLKINSPGGSVSASFQTETSISKLQQEKPVVGSMQQYAASGAYLIASAADNLYAYEHTTTAGLGVIAVWVSYEDYFENKGIDYFVWKTGEQKDMFSIWRKPTPEENEYLQELVENYQDSLFFRIGQNRPNAQLDNIRDGLTVSGWDALELNLIDGLKTYKQSVKKAAEMAGLEEGEYSKVKLSEYFKE